MTSEENPDYPNGTNRHYIQNLTTEVPDSMELSQYDLPEHRENWKVWSEGVSDEKLVPGGVSLTSDESRTIFSGFIPHGRKEHHEQKTTRA